jgi:hypothetical protein
MVDIHIVEIFNPYLIRKYNEITVLNSAESEVVVVVSSYG